MDMLKPVHKFSRQPISGKHIFSQTACVPSIFPAKLQIIGYVNYMFETTKAGFETRKAG